MAAKRISHPDPSPTQRRYDSPVRRQRQAETRERIIQASTDLAHQFKSWSWHDLTFRAVAEQAGVSLRTVYRHFPSEEALHDAVMERLERIAGVCYEGISLEDVAPVAGRVFTALASFGVAPSTHQPNEPTFLAQDERRKSALRTAVEEASHDWSDEDRTRAAAMLDVIWNLPSFERLTQAWGLDERQAVETVDWAIGLIIEAVNADRRPVPQQQPHRRRLERSTKPNRRAG